MLEFQELKVFVSILETGGFQRAGKALHLTQSAVSQSLANLERKVGQQLIERGSPLRPTVVGSQLLSHARIILEREKDFVSDLTKLKRGHLQKLSLVVDYLINEYFAKACVELTLEQFPEMSFKIKRLPAREMILAVQSDQFDLGFGPFQKNMESLKTHRLFEETSYLVARPDALQLRLLKENPLRFLKSTVLLASYLDEPALRPSKTKIRDYFKAAWEIDNIALQIQLVDSGVGATYIPQTILETNETAKKFRILSEIPFHRVSKPYGIYHKDDGQLTQCGQLFLDQARKALR